jgi:hypothetical protein
MEESEGTRINAARVEEALKKDSETLITILFMIFSNHLVKAFVQEFSVGFLFVVYLYN